MGENICKSHNQKRLIFKIYKEFTQLNNKKTIDITNIKNELRNWTVFQRGQTNGNRYLKGCSTSLIGRCKSKPQCYLMPIRKCYLLSERQEITNAGRVGKKQNPSALLVGMQIGAAIIMESSMGFHEKIKHRII